MQSLRAHLFLGSETSTSVNNLDVKLSSTFNDFDTLLGTNVVGNLSSVATVVHQQKVELLDIADGELAETVRQHVASLLGRAVTDLGHSSLTLETTTHGIVNTLGLSPRFLKHVLLLSACIH